jgi:hypothetical protein
MFLSELISNQLLYSFPVLYITINGFGQDDRLNVSGLNASFIRRGNDTLINAGSQSLEILKGYSGSVGLV